MFSLFTSILSFISVKVGDPTVSSHSHGQMAAGTALTAMGTTSTFMLGSLHISEIAMIVSSFAAICGVAIQLWVAVKSFKKSK